MEHLQRTHAVFGTTQWTLVGSLRSNDQAVASAASEALMRTYWPAVYSYLRGCGQSRHAAAETTQAFFVDVVIGRGLFDRAEQESGRLRNFILTALERFRIDQHRRNQARGGNTTISQEAIEREEQLSRCRTTEHPHDQFTRRWAVASLEEALRRCEQHFQASGKPGHWRLFERRILAPAASGGTPPSLGDLLESTGFNDVAIAAAAVQTVKKRALAILREVVAETLDDASQLDDEVAALQESLRLS